MADVKLEVISTNYAFTVPLDAFDAAMQDRTWIEIAIDPPEAVTGMSGVRDPFKKECEVVFEVVGGSYAADYAQSFADHVYGEIMAAYRRKTGTDA